MAAVSLVASPRRLHAALVLVPVALLLHIGRLAPAVGARAVSDQPAVTTTMHPFVIIFRQGPRTLTDAEKRERSAETTIWARRQNDAGHKLEPRVLAPERALAGASSAAGAADTQAAADASLVTALLFLEARDLREAAQVAESHPARRYGAAIEVRPWASPIPPSPPPKTPPAP